jgi:hypothetical protein
MPTPIFVDSHDTACAVGHLMRLSGWKREVASIRLNNNLVYVADIATGSVARWILTSGLTLEEAALIQPSYGAIVVQPPMPEDAIKLLESHWSGIVGDLRFSNFKILPETDTATNNISVSHGYCSRICVLPSPADVSRVLIQFDVETLSPFQRLASRPYGSRLLTYLGQPVSYARNEIGLYLSDDRAELFFDHSEDGSDLLQPIATKFEMFIDLQPFDPTTNMTVITEMLVSDGHPYEAQRLHFEVVTIPEPAAAILFAAACAAICAGRHRRIPPKSEPVNGAD